MDRIEVMIPEPHEPNHGVHAKSHSSASRVTIRTNERSRLLTSKWATILGMSESEFMRASSYNMARALEARAAFKEKHDDTDTGNRSR
jgi:uncharacterized protein (DUF1778 family)